MGILDTVKDAVTLVQKADNIDLMRQLLQVQVEAGVLLEENQTLKARVRELEAVQSTAAQLRFDPPFYFLADEAHPYCIRCWDEYHRLIHLVEALHARWNCPSCKNVFSKPRPEPEGVSFVPVRRPPRGF